MLSMSFHPFVIISLENCSSVSPTSKKDEVIEVWCYKNCFFTINFLCSSEPCFEISSFSVKNLKFRQFWWNKNLEVTYIDIWMFRDIYVEKPTSLLENIRTLRNYQKHRQLKKLVLCSLTNVQQIYIHELYLSKKWKYFSQILSHHNVELIK